MKLLRKDGTKRASSYDNRSFRTEWAAGPDGNGRRERFEDRHFGRNTAATEQNGFEGFGNAMPANFFRTKPRHQSDDERANHRHQRYPITQMISLRNCRGGGKAVIEGQVGDGGNQPNQGIGDQGAERSDGR